MGITGTATYRHQQAKNIDTTERIASAVGGGALVAYGFQKKGWSGAGWAALGGALLYRGATGHSQLYQMAGINTARRSSGRNVSVPYELGVRVDRSVIIDKTPEEVYRFWRNLENLPRFMHHLDSVTEQDNKHSRWVARGLAGQRMEWQAETINDIENELIGWRSLPGSDVDNAGSVHFKPGPNGRGTEVLVELQYNPPGGVLGAAVAKLFRRDPSTQIEADLRRLKELLETGSIAGAPKRRWSSGPGWRRDTVGLASEESFPASDPPSWTPETLAR